MLKVLSLAAVLILCLVGSSSVHGQDAAPSGWQVAWRAQLPLLTAALQVGDGRLYGFSGNNVFALETAGGAPLWSIRPPRGQGRALLIGCCQNGAVPTGGGVFTLAGGTEVWALDPASGEPRWRRWAGLGSSDYNGVNFTQA